MPHAEYGRCNCCTSGVRNLASLLVVARTHFRKTTRMSRPPAPTLPQKLACELLGTGILLAAIVGSGIMAAKLSGGNLALALLAHALATGAALTVLISVYGPVSGAHFNPAVSLAFRLNGALTNVELAAYCAVQVAGGCLGVLLAHIMFDLPLMQAATSVRTGIGQWTSEGVATFGLVLTILMLVKLRPDRVPVAVGLYIMSAIWFTGSTSFANPAVTIARSFTNTFTGIRTEDCAMFILAQILGATAAWLVARLITPETK